MRRASVEMHNAKRLNAKSLCIMNYRERASGVETGLDVVESLHVQCAGHGEI